MHQGPPQRERVAPGPLPPPKADATSSLREALGALSEHDFMAPRPGENFRLPPEPLDPFQAPSTKRESRAPSSTTSHNASTQALVKEAYSLMGRLVDVLDALLEREQQ